VTRLTAWVDGVSLIGPGLEDWPAAQALLAGRAAYVPAPTRLAAPAALPPTERRRAGRPVKLALALGFEAATQAAFELATLTTVFASSGGDGENCHAICETLASADRQLSPTRFHNSVHNAPAGYWSIATGARAPSSALCAYDASFGAGMLEALAEVATLGAPALLVAYDDRYPFPLDAKRPLGDALGTALALSPVRSPRSLARLDVALEDGHADRLADPDLERLRAGTPAGRSLPLLALLARRESGSVRLEYLDALTLRVEVERC
jgi:hypothetical protein